MQEDADFHPRPAPQPYRLALRSCGLGLSLAEVAGGLAIVTTTLLGARALAWQADVATDTDRMLAGVDRLRAVMHTLKPPPGTAYRGVLNEPLLAAQPLPAGWTAEAHGRILHNLKGDVVVRGVVTTGRVSFTIQLDKVPSPVCARLLASPRAGWRYVGVDHIPTSLPLSPASASVLCGDATGSMHSLDFLAS